MAQDQRQKRPTRQRKKRRLEASPEPASPIISSAESSSSENEPAEASGHKSKSRTNSTLADASKVVGRASARTSIGGDASARKIESSSASSPEVSPDECFEASSEEQQETTTPEGVPRPDSAPMNDAQTGTAKAALALAVVSAPPKTAAEQRQADFESWYLKAMTEQFADDLDKVRQAPDFKSSSVPMLVKALKQGVEMFSDKERDFILDGGR